MNEAKETQIRRFSGEGQDAQKEYRRWKRWSRAYLTVQRAKGVPETALGSILFTLLDGAALRAFDAMEMDQLEQAGGQDLVYGVLDDRFPEEAIQDRLGEVLDGVFDLKVDKGETTAVYTGKARAAFSAAEAEGVKFPDVARGYLLMRFARLSAEKRAVVLAASRQSYAEQDIAAALRTTYPDNLYSGRQQTSVAQVFHEPEEEDEIYADDGDDNVLASEAIDLDALVGDEPIEEQDAVDVLMTWKQTRSQINKEKISRGLSGSSDFKKIEARVRCFRCKKVGHFSRNCPVKKGTGKGNNASSSTSSGTTRANCVFMVADRGPEWTDEVLAILDGWKSRPRDFWRCQGQEVVREHVVPRGQMFCPRWSGCPVPFEQLQMKRKTIMFNEDGTKKVLTEELTGDPLQHRRPTHQEWTGQTIFYKKDRPEDKDEVDEICACFHALSQEAAENFEEPLSDAEVEMESSCHLMHDAGFGVVDTGCGRGVVGEATLGCHVEALARHGLQVEELESRPHRFKYGNGESDMSFKRVQIPIFVKGREMRMRLHVVPGEVPLLISKRFLKSLGARVELDSNDLYFSKIGIKTKMIERPDGSSQLDLLDMKASEMVSTPEVDVMHLDVVSCPRMETKVLVAEQEERSDDEYDDDVCLLQAGAHCVFKGHERRVAETVERGPHSKGG